MKEAVGAEHDVHTTLEERRVQSDTRNDRGAVRCGRRGTRQVTACQMARLRNAIAVYTADVGALPARGRLAAGRSRPLSVGNLRPGSGLKA